MKGSYLATIGNADRFEEDRSLTDWLADELVLQPAKSRTWSIGVTKEYRLRMTFICLGGSHERRRPGVADNTR